MRTFPKQLGGPPHECALECQIAKVRATRELKNQLEAGNDHSLAVVARLVVVRRSRVFIIIGWPQVHANSLGTSMGGAARFSYILVLQMRIPRSLASLLLVLSPAVAHAEGSASSSAYALLRHPTVSKTTVVFEYAGDLWSVSRDGGAASHLTTNAGIEDNPYFSPDGTQIAFSGEYDGNVDVFVMPATGGVP